jgi:site-specific DNA-cytosine methylase
VSDRVFTALFPFGGLGAGARGFLDAEVRMLGKVGRFRSLGGLDFDRIACADFERLTGTPSWCVDVEAITAAELRERYGARAPDVVFMSPPCKGASRLLGAAKAATEKYQRMNRLAVVWTEKMLEAWPEPPALVLLENVPGLPQRAATMLRELKARLRAAGYLFTHSTHDCGELGGLAQHRTRFLLVARHPKRCPPLLYQPPKLRVRGVGEVLSTLPMPATTAAAAWGELHTMPRLSWRNWLRLALIPAGGDWRDLAGVLEGRARREVFRRHAVADWREPIDTVTGDGGHAVGAVQDPRIMMRERDWGGGTFGVLPFDEAARTVAGESSPSNGRYSVADPRARGLLTGDRWHHGALGVRPWDEPAATVTRGDHPAKGRFSVADPRLGAAPPGAFHNVDRVLEWDDSAPTVTSGRAPSSGRPAIADPRLAMPPSDARHWSKLDVRAWDDPALTVVGKEGPANGGPSVADPRVEVSTAYDRGYGVLRWAQPSPTVAGTVAAGTGAYAVADPRELGFVDGVRLLSLDDAMALHLDASKPPPFLPVIVADDGTWHRPLTLLELAALQGIPSTLNGAPLRLTGTRTQVAEHVGNAVPVPTARAIAERMLVALVEGAEGAFSLSSGGAVWIAPEERQVST